MATDNGTLFIEQRLIEARRARNRNKNRFGSRVWLVWLDPETFQEASLDLGEFLGAFPRGDLTKCTGRSLDDEGESDLEAGSSAGRRSLGFRALWPLKGFLRPHPIVFSVEFGPSVQGDGFLNGEEGSEMQSIAIVFNL